MTYGTRVLIQAQAILSFNNSEKDVIPPLSLALVEDIILKFGISQSIHTDQGSNCMSEVFGNVCKLLNIKR
jgi:hypothetical protein